MWNLESVTAARPTVYHFFVEPNISVGLDFAVMVFPHTVISVNNKTTEVTFFDMIDFVTDDPWRIDFGEDEYWYYEEDEDEDL
ncbi:MAG: hypothetical protein NC548_23015 [Lachnospiraceae bacterium]|nr:hypothetical protein [Lachnospiraceae bacterium]